MKDTSPDAFTWQLNKKWRHLGEKRKRERFSFLSVSILARAGKQNTPLLMQEEEEEDALYVS